MIKEKTLKGIINSRYYLLVFLLLLPLSGYTQQQALNDTLILMASEAYVRVGAGAIKMHSKVAEINVKEPGYFRINPLIDYNSGDDQLNESFYITITSPDGTEITPQRPNAGPYKIVVDSPGPAHFAWRDAGRFNIPKGINTIYLHHYGAIDSLYPELLNGPMSWGESVHIVDSLKIITEPNIDGSLKIKTNTAQVKLIDGIEQKFVNQGDIIEYDLIVRNEYLNDIRFATLWNRFPESVNVEQVSHIPSIQSNNEITWNLPQIAPQDSVVIHVTARLKHGALPIGFTQLIDNAKLTAPSDLDTTNNNAQAIVYTEPYIDGSIQIQANSAREKTVNGKRFAFVYPGELVTYNLIVRNEYYNSINSAQLWNRVPDLLNIEQLSLAPRTRINNELTWDLPEIAAQDSFIITVTARLANDAQIIGLTQLPDEAKLTVPNDKDTTNNTAHAIVYSELNIDGALQIQVNTAQQKMINGAMHDFINPGETIEYELTVRNIGLHQINSAQLWNQIPEKLNIEHVSLVPKTQIDNELSWDLPQIASQDSFVITITASLSNEVHYIGLTQLFDNATLTVPDDIDTTNNTAQALIYTEHNIDGALQIHANTARQKMINNNLYGFIQPGESVEYDLVIHNYGLNVLTSAQLWNRVPAILNIEQTSTSPASQVDNEYTWNLPQIAPQDSFIITLTANLAADINPDSVTRLLDEAKLIVANDIDTTNNKAQAIIYTDELNIDGSLIIRANTPQERMIWGSQEQLLYPGETVEYFLVVHNVGLDNITSAQLHNNIPANITIEQLSYAATQQNGRKTTWNLPEIVTQDSFKIKVTAKLTEGVLPFGLTQLYDNAEIIVPNDIDTTNNQAQATIYALADSRGRKPVDMTEFNPRITALPLAIDVTDSINIQVQSPSVTQNWDLWVHLPDGQIETDFADNFVAATNLQPNQWYNVNQLYYPLKLINTGKEEQLIFEIRAQDVFGNDASAQASVTVRSSNYLVLDRNVFRPGMENPLEISFKLSNRRVAQLDIYDITGRHIVKITEDVYDGAWNTYPWDGIDANGKKIGSGTYLVTLRSGEFNSWKKFLIVR